MRKNLPDKWVRKAIYDLINDIEVDGFTIPCYDSRVYDKVIPDHYVLMTTQTNDENKANKCSYRWESSILLDVFTSYPGVSNPGSRFLADNIVDRILTLTQNIQLDDISDLKIQNLTINFPNDIVSITSTQNVYRKFMRFELTIV